MAVADDDMMVLMPCILHCMAVHYIAYILYCLNIILLVHHIAADAHLPDGDAAQVAVADYDYIYIYYYSAIYIL